MPDLSFDEELIYLLQNLYHRDISIASVHNLVMARFESQRSEFEEQKRLAVLAVLEQTKEHLEDV